MKPYFVMAALSRASWCAALLFFASFSDGNLNERVLALPPRAFVQAAYLMDALGWLEVS